MGPDSRPIKVFQILNVEQGASFSEDVSRRKSLTASDEQSMTTKAPLRPANALLTTLSGMEKVWAQTKGAADKVAAIVNICIAFISLPNDELTGSVSDPVERFVGRCLDNTIFPEQKVDPVSQTRASPSNGVVVG
jgi:hypothetical protein